MAKTISKSGNKGKRIIERTRSPFWRDGIVRLIDHNDKVQIALHKFIIETIENFEEELNLIPLHQSYRPSIVKYEIDVDRRIEEFSKKLITCEDVATDAGAIDILRKRLIVLQHIFTHIVAGLSNSYPKINYIDIEVDNRPTLQESLYQLEYKIKLSIRKMEMFIENQIFKLQKQAKKKKEDTRYSPKEIIIANHFVKGEILDLDSAKKLLKKYGKLKDGEISSPEKLLGLRKFTIKNLWVLSQNMTSATKHLTCLKNAKKLLHQMGEDVASEKLKNEIVPFQVDYNKKYPQ